MIVKALIEITGDIFIESSEQVEEFLQTVIDYGAESCAVDIKTEILEIISL